MSKLIRYIAVRCCRFTVVLVCWLVQGGLLGQEPTFSQSEVDFFENKIRPIFHEHCSECHAQAGGQTLQGGLSVQTRAAILKGGDTGPAIVAGQSGSSLLIDAINYRGYYEMPPSTKLPADKIRLLEEWVDRGAPWSELGEHAEIAAESFDLQKRKAEHWAWQPIKSGSPPVIEDTSMRAWPSDSIDQFILHDLQERGLKPAVDANRYALIRRVYFDLIGLPPSRETVDAFVNDDSPDAFEKIVDELLDSPAFGERWARHWMDLVRYAETYGHEFDFPIAHAWEYRDYLIRAFNDDVPYDDFVREHIAGDLLEAPRLNPDSGFNESIIGTGFWFLGEATHAPVDVRADEAGRIDNQIDVLCKTFQGLTVACARCHDHKFDAISTADFYSLAGILQSSRRQLGLLENGGEISEIAVQTQSAINEYDALPDNWLGELNGIGKSAWRTELEQLPDDAVLENGVKFDLRSLMKNKSVEKPDHPLHLLWLGVRNDELLLKRQIREVRNAWENRQQCRDQFLNESKLLEDFDDGIPNDWFVVGWAFNQGVLPLHFSVEGDIVSPGGLATTARLGKRFEGVLRSPTFELTHDKIAVRVKSNGCQIRAIIDGYEMDIHNPLLFKGCFKEVNQPNKFEWVEFDTDFKNYKGHKAYLEFIDHGENYIQVDEVRLLDDGAADPVDPPSSLLKLMLDQEPVDQSSVLDAAATAFDEFFAIKDNELQPEQAALATLLLKSSKQVKRAGESIRDARLSMVAISKELPAARKVIAATDGSPENEHLFIRGNSDTLGDIVPRGFLTALQEIVSATSNNYSSGSGRLELANQIASEENPLTSRVIVNRVWRHLFGAGIVSSVDNFGVLGQPPSHPELLDYLAGQFCDDEWSIKRFVRRLVLTRTYRMSSAAREAADRVDPENRLLHRANVKRLQAEAIRDSILQISGSLDRGMFGRSVEVHLTEFMQGRGRPRASGPVDGAGRRSVYVEVRRNFLSPMMLAFDAPIPFNTIGNRHQSNVPAQALILMNDPFVVDQAEKWARRLMKASNQTRSRIKTAFHEAFGRPASSDELDAMELFLTQQATERGLELDSIGVDVKLWRDLCHVVFNMKEFIYIK